MKIQEVEEKLKTVEKFEWEDVDGKTYIIEKTPNGFRMTKKGIKQDGKL